MGNATDRKENLPRLPREAYRGIVDGHWVFNIAGKKRGWLNERFFLQFQLIATHAFSRYRIASPCLCLMPDHIHLLLMGYHWGESDQRLAVHFIRKHLKTPLAPTEFQKTPYDHLLRKKERDRSAFQRTAGYIRNNPVRAGLVDEDGGNEWPYQCAIVPGYPDLHPGQKDFWDLFWRIYYRILVTD